MAETDPAALTAAEAARAMREGRLRAVELIEACLERIAKHDASLKAWVHLAPEHARQQAREIDARRAKGETLPPLAGLPVGIKDVFNTKDFPTGMGSPIWKDFTPGNDARVVHYLKMAGAVLPGKTVTAEFAVHTPGPTVNPHHLDHSPGTSSSGSAAAVAARMVPLALGTQTAGSVIRPASYCGVHGFKPSFGLVPRTGVLKTADTLDHVGWYGRSADDLALMFDVCRVRGRDYPISDAALKDPARQTRGAGPWRVGVVRGPKWSHAEKYAQDALLAFAHEASRKLGSAAAIEEVELPEGFERAHETHTVLYDRCLAYYFKDEFRRPALVSPTMQDIVERGNSIALADYKRALEGQAQLAAKLDQHLTRYHVLLGLSTGGEAPVGRESPDRPDNCLVWTLCGAAAASLPVFRGPNGLPFGLQVVARKYSDYLLLDFCRELERAGLSGEAPVPEFRQGAGAAAARAGSA